MKNGYAIRHRLATRAAEQQAAKRKDHPALAPLTELVPFVAHAIAEQGWVATLRYARDVRRSGGTP